ncbi:Dihydrolipoyllysine-residue succinyltransferase component of 2-oxoglutarate dehydrogenase complex, mitochondrial [Penicillium subrubescens]|uniref:dihydrolipoyllysine-residue succinyltransferase n=2 Tax=Penicillium subrubescens TaxID=1316194 RepID=A0A1Q5UR82_9EURO|nr:Dihydrolipoyllysine-residue succinyltransferase component of 2-oxoglutarate dehydrogenase complex, mitochondrial [Penicillium subrubescens]
MTRIRQKTAQHLKESQNKAAFLTTFNEVDMSKIIKFRKKNKDRILEKHGVKLGFMGAMAKASVLALKEIPAVNASVENSDTIVYRDYVDLSVAASIPEGLVTPVLRNIESMSIVEIEKGISELVAKARDGKLTMEDLMGGSFTISNSGIWGSLFGTSIINMPQTAVLGTYGILDRPAAVNGRAEIRPMMYIALTYEHRILDGREAVRFLNTVNNNLERPESMLWG